MAHKDLLGRELHINDLVILQVPNYAELMVAKVEALTPKKVRISYPDRLRKSERVSTLRDSHCMYKMHDDDAIVYRLTDKE